MKYINHCSLLSLKVFCAIFFLNVWFFKWVLLFCFGGLVSILVPIGIDMKCSGKSSVLYIYSPEHLKVLYCCLNLFYDIPYFCFVLNLRLFCTSFYTDVVILICHLLPIRLYLIRSWKCVVP